MTNLPQKLTTAQNYAMSIKPKAGGFPVLAEVLRQAGVLKNRWSLPSCQAIYIFMDGAVVQQGTPLCNGTADIQKFNQDALIAALRTDQAGHSTFPEFLQATWQAGIVAYEVDFVQRTVTYSGVNGESYSENYPMVEAPGSLSNC